MPNVLVVAAHPDDEILGCGATIARHADAGDEVHILILADGETSRIGGDREKRGERAARNASAEAAAAVVGAAGLTLLDFPDNAMDGLPLLEIVQAIEPVIEKLRPEIIYTHHGADLNIDHGVTHRAVMTAARPLPASPVRLIATFEVLSSTEWSLPPETGTFAPQMFVDVAASIDRKIEALGCYEQEMRPFPHPRSEEAVRALAAFRGATSGLQSAEAFGVMRRIAAKGETI